MGKKKKMYKFSYLSRIPNNKGVYDTHIIIVKAFNKQVAESKAMRKIVKNIPTSIGVGELTLLF